MIQFCRNGWCYTLQEETGDTQDVVSAVTTVEPIIIETFGGTVDRGCLSGNK